MAANNYHGADTVLADSKSFFDALRTGLLGPTLSASEVAGCEAILSACGGWSASWTAYALATAYHETKHTMQPVREDGTPAYFLRMYDIEGQRPAVARVLGNLKPGDGALYAGRGYVQLTGRGNYAKAQIALGPDFVVTPDLALEPANAARILRLGIGEGWFTGQRLSNYLYGPRGTARAFVSARRVINGQDRAEMVAEYAMQFQTALASGGWR